MSLGGNNISIISFILVFCFISCEKSDINYSDMPIDNRLIGNWHRSYSVVGAEVNKRQKTKDKREVDKVD